MSRLLLPDMMVFSALLRNNVPIRDRMVDELASGATEFVSPVVYFELRRGLLKKDAHRQLAFLDSLVARLVWVEFTRADWDEAADLWVVVQRAGRPGGDADLLIAAAQANRRGAVIVTDNVDHFQDTANEMETWES